MAAGCSGGRVDGCKGAPVMATISLLGWLDGEAAVDVGVLVVVDDVAVVLVVLVDVGLLDDDDNDDVP